MTTRNTRAAIASFRETVNATKTMIALLTRFPTIGTRPQRNVIAIRSGACGIRTITTNSPVNALLISEIVIWAPITVATEDFGKDGKLPVFVLRVRGEDDKITERKYKMNGVMVRRVLAPGEEPPAAHRPPAAGKRRHR